MRVLYLGGFELPDKNAAAQRVVSNGMLLKDLGFEVTFVGVNKNGLASIDDYNGFRSESIIYPRNISEWFYNVTTFIKKEKLLSYNPDFVVLYNFPAIASLKILRYCHKHGIKVIHDLTEWEQTDGLVPRAIIKRIDTQLRMRYSMKKMDGVIAISKYLYNYYKDYTKTVQIPPTVDLDNPKWLRNRELKAEGSTTLVYAGSPGAGVKDRLDLIVDEVKKRDKFKLIVIGLTEKQYFESFNKQRSHYDNIIFKGRLPHKDTIREVCNADFQMLIRENTLKNKAGFPTKLAESIACGIPIIATIFSNITDYLKEGENCFFVNEQYSLGDILNRVGKMDKKKIIQMKQNCLNMRVFDYRTYKYEFEQLFK